MQTWVDLCGSLAAAIILGFTMLIVLCGSGVKAPQRRPPPPRPEDSGPGKPQPSPPPPPKRW